MYKKKKNTAICFIFVSLLALLISLYDTGVIGKGTSCRKIKRYPAGGGKHRETYTVRRKGEEEKSRVEVEVEEKTLTKKEARAEVKSAAAKLDKEILCDNASFEHVDKKLFFPTRLKGSPVSITWSFDPGNLVDHKGNIFYERISDEGTLLHVKALVTCRGEEARYERQMRLCIPKKTGLSGDIFEAVRQFRFTEEHTREKESVALPEKINGREIIWEKERKNRGPVVFILGSVLVLIPLVREKESISKERKDKRRKSREDYPDIVLKMALLVGAGMTVRNAFMKIGLDYKKKGGEKRPAYEEMLKTCRELGSGQSEAYAYEEFGRRMELPVYVKLGQILSQQIRIGGRGLKGTLEAEATVAFEEKKNSARRRGEEVSTKLLIPMFMMMGIVLAIVMVPAFISMRVK